MAKRPTVPPFDSLASPLGDRINPVLGYGSLDTGVGETMSLPAGSQGPTTRMAGEDVNLVKDEAVRAAIDDLAKDFSTFVSQQKSLLTDLKTSMSDFKAALDELTRAAKASVGSVPTGGGGGAYVPGHGSPTAGMTTTTTLRQAAATLGHTVLNAVVGADGVFHVPMPGTFSGIPMGPVPGGSNLPVPRPAGTVSLPGAGHPGTVATTAAGAAGGAGGSGSGGSSGGVILGPNSMGGGGGSKGVLSAIRPGPLPILQTLAAVRYGYEAYLDQNAKNRRFQQIFGGTNHQQFGVRTSEEGFRLSHFGLSSADDKQMYEDAADLGLRDKRSTLGGLFGQVWNGQAASSAVAGHASASQAADTAYDLKRGQGIDTGEFFSTYEVALKNGASGLGQVAQSLRDVTDAAREFGVNAVMVRQNFQQMFGATTQSGFRAGAAGLADVLTQQVTSGGMTLSDVNAAGMVSDSMTYRYSAASGMTHGQFLAAASANPTVAAEAISHNGDQIMSAYLGAAKDYIVQRIQTLNAQGANVKDNEALKNQIAGEVAQQFGATLDPSVLAQVLNKQMGLNLTADNAIYYCVNWLAGNSPAAIAQQVQAKSGLQSGTHSAKGPGGLASIFEGPSGAETAYASLTKTGGSDGYMKGSHSPVIDALLKNTKHGADGKVAVDTLHGKRVMSIKDAIKEFPAEVAAGKVTMVGGTQNGESVTQVAGGLADNTDVTTAEAKKELTDSTLADQGTDYDAYIKKHPSKNKNADTSGKFTLDLTPAARSLLQLVPGNAAAASGNPLSPGS